MHYAAYTGRIYIVHLLASSGEKHYAAFAVPDILSNKIGRVRVNLIESNFNIKLFGVPNNLGVHPFQDTVVHLGPPDGHFGYQRVLLASLCWYLL